jgi:hypothetical protein
MQETVQTWMGFSSEPLSCAARSSRAPWPCVGPTPPPAAIHGFPRSAHEGTVRRRAPHTPPPPMHVRPRLGERDARAGLIGDGRPRGSGHDSLDSRPTARRWLIASPIFCHTPIAHPSADAPILHGHMRPISNALLCKVTEAAVCRAAGVPHQGPCGPREPGVRHTRRTTARIQHANGVGYPWR